jgi:hypothetical protein
MADTPLPDPLVPAEVNLQDFQYMELDVRKLRDSSFAARVSGEAFRAGVLLWCASWHQAPAGSLPDDDIDLAQLAGYGRVVKEWRKVKTDALRGWVKCSDGRLYHKAVCEKALAAWNAKLRHHYDKARDRLRKANKARAAEGQPQLPEISFEEWNALRISSGNTVESAEAFAPVPTEGKEVPTEPSVPSAGIPAENALKGNGEGTEREQKLPEGAPSASAPVDAREDGEALSEEPLGTAASVGKALVKAGMQATSFHHSNPHVIALVSLGASELEVVEVTREALEKGNGLGWIVGAIKGRRGDVAKVLAKPPPPPRRIPPGGRILNRQEAIEAENRRVADEWVRQQEEADARK